MYQLGQQTKEINYVRSIIVTLTGVTRDTTIVSMVINNNNNNVHLSCAHQRPEAHTIYINLNTIFYTIMFFKFCIVSTLVCVDALCVCVYTLRIVSMHNVLHFMNNLISIINNSFIAIFYMKLLPAVGALHYHKCKETIIKDLTPLTGQEIIIIIRRRRLINRWIFLIKRYPLARVKLTALYK